MRFLIAPDKFKGTATASEVASSIQSQLSLAGHIGRKIPMADGGEGLLDVFGGPNQADTVTGPNGAEILATWRLDGQHAIIEMATASGLVAAGGRENNDPLAATSRGTGELIAAAIQRGATQVIVGLGGSACTDGGSPAIDALAELFAEKRASSFKDLGVEVVVATDVGTRFRDAAHVFGPQKGASAREVIALQNRLECLENRYFREYCIKVNDHPGSGAAGGLGGGLLAIGADLVAGFDLVARHLGLAEAVQQSDIVITGEGRFDATSLEGKVVGGLVNLATLHARRLVVIAGQADQVQPLPEAITSLISLSELFGPQQAQKDPLGCIAQLDFPAHIRSWR